MFYELPPSIEKVISNPSVLVSVRLCFCFGDSEFWVPCADVVECSFNSYKSVEGGIINSGEVILDNSRGVYCSDFNGAFDRDLAVLVYFCFGSYENSFLRFNLFVDCNGFQCEETGGKFSVSKIRLVDLSVKLNDLRLQKNWSSKNIAVHSVVCDKEHPESSLVHIIAKRCGLSAGDIDCGKLPFKIPYVEINRSAWQELCDIASIYRANLECGKDMPLSFTESPYDLENSFIDDSSFFLGVDDITHYRAFNSEDDFSNNIRIKYTRFVETGRQELWHYDDGPAWYDEFMNVAYPFSDDSRAIVSSDDYEAIYSAKNENGHFRNVVYAEDVDNLAAFEKNIVTDDDKKFSVLKYDTSSFNDRAVLQLSRNNQLIALRRASIYGRAIIAETNFSVFVKDEDSVKKNGAIVKNVTSKYFSDDLFKGVPFYSVRAGDFLKDGNRRKKGYFISTSLALVHGRVGACMDINVNKFGSDKKVRVEELTFRYKKNGGFCTELWVVSV